MDSLTLATWVLAGLTGLLAIATLLYAYFTYQLLKASKDQSKLVEEHNSLLARQNKVFEDQTLATYQQAVAMNEQVTAIHHLQFAIENLPSEHYGLQNRRPR